MSCEGCRATVLPGFPAKARCLCDTRDIEAFIQYPNDAAYWPVRERRCPVADAPGVFVAMTMDDALSAPWAA